MFYLPDPNTPDDQFAKQSAESSAPVTGDLLVINPDGSPAAAIKNIGIRYEMGCTLRLDADRNAHMTPTEVSLVPTGRESHGYTVKVDPPAPVEIGDTKAEWIFPVASTPSFSMDIGLADLVIEGSAEQTQPVQAPTVTDYLHKLHALDGARRLVEGEWEAAPPLKWTRSDHADRDCPDCKAAEHRYNLLINGDPAFVTDIDLKAKTIRTVIPRARLEANDPDVKFFVSPDFRIEIVQAWTPPAYSRRKDRPLYRHPAHAPLAKSKRRAGLLLARADRGGTR